MNKLSVLSNVNINFVIRKLKANFQVYDTEGYGNELGILLNKASSYYEFNPDITFMIMDICELIGQEYSYESAMEKIGVWFGAMETAVAGSNRVFISDAYAWSPVTDAVADQTVLAKIEAAYLNKLEAFVCKHGNVSVFPYSRIVKSLGETNSFSSKMWYMGKILHTNDFQNALALEIEKVVKTESRVAKKVLVLDLDNTLWGGLAGDYPESDVTLSDDHQGLIYKNAQRIIKEIKNSGAVLAICSKNNEQDAMYLIENHPHMILSKDDFVVCKINWEQKDKNIVEIASELNVGLDSLVFWDDSETERELIRQSLPEVVVGEFPGKVDEIPNALTALYKEYFSKNRLTKEDMDKTNQYIQNKKRDDLAKSVGNFRDYLKSLKITIERVSAEDNEARLLQLVNKTNQFNLTTIRYEASEIKATLESDTKEVYLYSVSDCFGDYGIVSAVIVDTDGDPFIEEFVLSCRVMGKKVEMAIVSAIEADLKAKGYKNLLANFIPTNKNMPVKNLFEDLGYTVLEDNDGDKTYVIKLDEEHIREYYVSWK